MEGPEMRRKRANAAYVLTFGALRRQIEGDSIAPPSLHARGNDARGTQHWPVHAHVLSAGLSVVLALGALSTPLHAQLTPRKVIPRPHEPREEALLLDDGADDVGRFSLPPNVRVERDVRTGRIRSSASTSTFRRARRMPR